MDPLLSKASPPAVKYRPIDCPLGLLSVIVEGAAGTKDKPKIIKAVAIFAQAVTLFVTCSQLYYLRHELEPTHPVATIVVGAFSVYIAIGVVLVTLILCSCVIFNYIHPTGFGRLSQKIKTRLARHPPSPLWQCFKVPICGCCVISFLLSVIFMVCSVVMLFCRVVRSAIE